MLFGHSQPMTEVRDLIERVADTDVTVLIRGESGIGKELVARALHEQSLRKDKPFVKVNCAALPTELLESELFGFEKGAFTGAIQHKPGKFEFANHGTMFLDEIGEMSFPLQAKLLQVAAGRRVLAARRQGRRARRRARHRGDQLRSRSGGCRRQVPRRPLLPPQRRHHHDLPPLRDRREEIPMLTDHFLKKYSVQYNKPFPAISRTLHGLFMEYDWPGNVRQLENLIKRMVVLGSEAPIVQELQQPRCTPLAASRPSAPRRRPPPQPVDASTGCGGRADRRAPSRLTPARRGRRAPCARRPRIARGQRSLKDISRTAAREAERELILRMLTQTRWNRKEAAEILGISYKALLYKIKENGLDKAS